MNRRDFQKLALIRLKDAEVLLKNGRFEAAYYLAGYAIECALKACIARQTKIHDFPRDRKFADTVYKHRLDELVTPAKLASARDALFFSDPDFKANYLVVQKWREDHRYEILSRADAEELLNAVRDRRHGVLRWIKRYW